MVYKWLSLRFEALEIVDIILDHCRSVGVLEYWYSYSMSALSLIRNHIKGKVQNQIDGGGQPHQLQWGRRNTNGWLSDDKTTSKPRCVHSTCDIQNFYLNTPMKEKEFFKLPIKIIPSDIIAHYKLTSLVHKDHVYIQVNKGMYGLPQEGILAYLQLVKRLAPYGFHPTNHTPGLWSHNKRPIIFTLVVDDFGIQYSSNEDANFLINALRSHYTITMDWSGSRYCGLHIEWEYQKREVTISMTEYVSQELHKFQHLPPKNLQPTPYQW